MIIVDTNVISETARSAPDPNVVTWLRTVDDDLYITATSVGELFLGVERLARGRRRSRLVRELSALMVTFHDRVLPYDETAGRQFGIVAAQRESLGRPITVADAQIAAICRSHNAICATRNVKDFADTGVELVNPWEVA